jgi:hypothetical protein
LTLFYNGLTQFYNAGACLWAYLRVKLVAMKPLLFFSLLLSLAACNEQPVKELALSSHEKPTVFSRDLESWHTLSGTTTTATRKINISASAWTSELRLK